MSDRPEWRVEHREAVDLLTEFIDDRLPAETRRSVAAHLETCAECRAWEADERRVKVMLAALPVVDVPRSFTLPVTERRPVAPVWLRPVRYATGLAAVLFLFVLGLNVLNPAPAVVPPERAASSQSAIAPEAATQTALESGLSTPVVAGATRDRSDPSQPDIFDQQRQPAPTGLHQGLRVALIASGALLFGFGAATAAGWWRSRYPAPN